MKLKRSEICIIALTLLLLAAAVGIQTGKGNSEADFSVENLNAVQAYSDDADSGRININTATAQELETLKGIGPALAQRIIDYRSEHGDFRRIEDIRFVRGISTQVFEDIRDFITVGQREEQK